MQVNSQGAVVLGGMGASEQYREHNHQVHGAKSTIILQVGRIGLLSGCPPEGAPPQIKIGSLLLRSRSDHPNSGLSVCPPSAGSFPREPKVRKPPAQLSEASE